jgi:hypothetical protein
VPPFGYCLLALLSSGSALGYLPPASRRSYCPVPQRKLPTPLAAASCHTRRRRRVWWAFNPTYSPKPVGSDTETFTKQDGTMNSDTPSRGSRGSSIEDTDDKEGIAGAAHDRLAEDVSAYCSGTATGDAGL